MINSGNEKRFAIVDVETTGGTTQNSRITDIGIFITDGIQVLDEFSTLVNPEEPIPYFITQLTGIDNDMVKDAPVFSEVAGTILDFLSGTTFIAHNVNFDYSMIRNEMQHMGMAFELPRYCTVRLARHFLPGHQSYGLGRICEDLGIAIQGRHRARGDAEATVELFKRIFSASKGNLDLTDQKWISKLPDQLDRTVIDALPESPGVFFLRNGQEEILEIGSSENIRKAILRKLTRNSTKAKATNAQVTSVDFEVTESKIIAEIYALREMEKLGIETKRATKAWGLSMTTDLFGYLHVATVPAPDEIKGVPTFRSKQQAEAYLSILCTEKSLCQRLCGFEKTDNCGSNANWNCPGACNQLESADSYNARVRQALKRFGEPVKDFVLLDPSGDKQAFIMVEKSQYIGYGLIRREEVQMSALDDFKNYLVRDTSTLQKIQYIRQLMKDPGLRMIAASV